MKYFVTALFTAAFAVVSMSAQAQTKPISATTTPAATVSILPPAPLMTKEDVRQRCVDWFTNKAEYTGTIVGQGAFTLVIWTENADMIYGRVTNRWVCTVKYSAWNARQEGAWNMWGSFDGNAVMWIDPNHKDPGIASVLALSHDGSTIDFSRRFRNSDGSFGTSAGTFQRKK